MEVAKFHYHRTQAVMAEGLFQEVQVVLEALEVGDIGVPLAHCQRSSSIEVYWEVMPRAL